MNYAQFANALKLELVIDQSDGSFDSLLPRIIEAAELRIYRDFDFLCTLGTQTTVLTAQTRSVALPTSIVVAESANIITPYTQTNPDLGARVALNRVSIEFLNAVYNSVAGAGVPTSYALIGTPSVGATTTAGGYNVLLGPWPDQAYTLEIVGTVRPSPLSTANPTTFISNNFPDLMIAAAMAYASGALLQNFGSQSDNPQQAMSWETQYQQLKPGVMVELFRRKSDLNGAAVTPAPNAQAS